MAQHWSEADLRTALARGDARLVGEPLPQPPPLSEAAFQGAILRLAKAHDWMAFHAYSMKRSPEGFPDVVLVREVVLVAELKLPGETPAVAQKAWLRAFVRCGHAEVYVWYPEHWEQIVARLSRKATMIIAPALGPGPVLAPGPASADVT